jgi:hypothetical protein
MTPNRDRIIQALGRATANWLNPQDPLRQEAVAALQVSAGFTGPMIESALEAAFGELTENKIRAFCQEDPILSGRAAGKLPRTVLHILAGNVFTAWLPGAVITLLLGGDCWLKPSSKEPVFAPLWRRSISRVDLGLAEKIQIVYWDEKLLRLVDGIVAYGRDETLAQLRPKVPAGVRWVGFGHKISAGVVFREAQVPGNRSALLERLRQDVEPFCLTGCLSPQIIYWEGGDPGPWEEVLRLRVPQTPQFKRFEDWGFVDEELSRLAPHWAAFGYAGPAERLDARRARLEELGFSRICPLGEMQRPPLSWRNGGISLTEALCGITGKGA